VKKRLTNGSNGSLKTRHKPDKHDSQVREPERGHKGARGAIRFKVGTSHEKSDIYETYETWSSAVGISKDSQRVQRSIQDFNINRAINAPNVPSLEAK
jgi:hypothetical protein